MTTSRFTYDQETAAAIVEKLNDYDPIEAKTGGGFGNIWRDLIMRLEFYNEEATAELDPEYTEHRFVAGTWVFERAAEGQPWRLGRRAPELGRRI